MGMWGDDDDELQAILSGGDGCGGSLHPLDGPPASETDGGFNAVQRAAPRGSAHVACAVVQAAKGTGDRSRYLPDRDVPGKPGRQEYRLTKAGEDLKPVIMSIGIWGQR